MAVIPWPMPDRQTYVRAHIASKSRDAGANLLGVAQIQGSAAQVWNITVSIAEQPDPLKIKEFEALISRMRGRENVAALPIMDDFGFNASVSPVQVGFSDGTSFTDGTGFFSAGAGVLAPVVSSGAAAGSRLLTINIVPVGRRAMRVGDLFSVNGFLYRVVSVGVGGDIAFEPRARQAIPAGTELITDPPVIYCRFSTDDQGARGRGKMHRAEAISLEFVEAFDR